MVGGVHDHTEIDSSTKTLSSGSYSADCWAFDFGVGADWRLADHWSWRIVEASYLATTFSSGNGDHWQDNWRVSTGLVFHLGGSRATTTTTTSAVYDSKDK